MGKTKRNIFVSIFGLVIIAAIIGFYLFNKEGPDIKNANAAKIAATDLYATFSKDTVAAKQMYFEKILEVSGVVTQLTKNQQSQPIILLKTATDEASINCTMEDTAVNLKAGDQISIKGICTGIGQGDADLGIAPDVYLIRCYVVR
ncbi:MAG: hypothetical protein JWQ09_6025 [Segetibacter sp.]|nr:hypothetical protein [Segetibacter sp.]